MSQVTCKFSLTKFFNWIIWNWIGAETVNTVVFLQSFGACKQRENGRVGQVATRRLSAEMRAPRHVKAAWHEVSNWPDGRTSSLVDARPTRETALFLLLLSLAIDFWPWSSLWLALWSPSIIFQVHGRSTLFLNTTTRWRCSATTTTTNSTTTTTTTTSPTTTTTTTSSTTTTTTTTSSTTTSSATTTTSSAASSATDDT